MKLIFETWMVPAIRHMDPSLDQTQGQELNIKKAPRLPNTCYVPTIKPREHEH